ncbi:MAG TPA: tRNA-uridine aminocarboxypropyltransferase [Stellaceae bacterium]|jgi:DTW domain-containing protein YfiP|nr:tRNA-uridine aminocarboxypropyltransferase [Stellaceae bacterium]
MTDADADFGADAPIDNRVFILVLQHPQERREPHATAAIAVGALRRAKLVAGLSWPNLARALGRAADPGRWGVLYLGSARPAAFGGAAASAAGDIFVLGRNGQPVADPQPVLRALDGIVLLDGTWSQAKTLWWRNSWLLKLHRLVLNPARPARLGRLRREPRREALSTLEAAAMMLRRLEPGPQPADALLLALEQMMAAASRPVQPAASA